MLAKEAVNSERPETLWGLERGLQPYLSKCSRKAKAKKGRFRVEPARIAAELRMTSLAKLGGLEMHKQDQIMFKSDSLWR